MKMQIKWSARIVFKQQHEVNVAQIGDMLEGLEEYSIRIRGIQSPAAWATSIGGVSNHRMGVGAKNLAEEISKMLAEARKESSEAAVAMTIQGWRDPSDEANYKWMKWM